jgi:preprotein translocase SecE subunit
MNESGLERMGRYLREVGVELKKTTWPSRAELIRSGQIVLGMLCLLGVYLALVEALLSRITQSLGLFR